MTMSHYCHSVAFWLLDEYLKAFVADPFVDHVNNIMGSRSNNREGYLTANHSVVRKHLEGNHLAGSMA
jgi:hypothetical protein